MDIYVYRKDYALPTQYKLACIDKAQSDTAYNILKPYIGKRINK